MAPDTPADGVAPAADLAATRSTEAVEFADLLVGDDEWVRREFDAIVAAGWGGALPPCPAPPQGAHWPRRPGYGDRPTPATRPKDRLAWGAAPARQRGPPRSGALRALQRAGLWRLRCAQADSNRRTAFSARRSSRGVDRPKVNPFSPLECARAPYSRSLARDTTASWCSPNACWTRFAAVASFLALWGKSGTADSAA